MTTTLIQSLITLILVSTARLISHILFQQILLKRRVASQQSNQETWLLRDDDSESSFLEDEKGSSHYSANSRISVINKRFKDVFSVAAVYLAKAGLNNFAIT